MHINCFGTLCAINIFCVICHRQSIIHHTPSRTRICTAGCTTLFSATTSIIQDFMIMVRCAEDRELPRFQAPAKTFRFLWTESLLQPTEKRRATARANIKRVCKYEWIGLWTFSLKSPPFRSFAPIFLWCSPFGRGILSKCFWHEHPLGFSKSPLSIATPICTQNTAMSISTINNPLFPRSDTN